MSDFGRSIELAVQSWNGPILAGLIFSLGLTHPLTMAHSPTDPPGTVVRSGAALDAWPGSIEPPTGLPEPPEELARLIERGNVSLIFYDAAKHRRIYVGETRFAPEFRVQTQFRWRQVRLASGERQLIIRPQFRGLKFTDTHRILLPISLADADLYNHPLVRHEFDHVRISTDPRFQRLFEGWLRTELKNIQIDLKNELSRAEIDQIAEATIDEQTAVQFRKMVELIEIRYLELDRLTQHGNRQPPDGYFQNGVLADNIASSEDE